MEDDVDVDEKDRTDCGVLEEEALGCWALRGDDRWREESKTSSSLSLSLSLLERLVSSKLFLLAMVVVFQVWDWLGLVVVELCPF